MALFCDVSQEICEITRGRGFDYSLLPPEVVSDFLNASAVPITSNNWGVLAAIMQSNH